MFLRFGVENYRSFLAPTELSFVATRGSEFPEHPRPNEHTRHGILPIVGLWGGNASGKSNLLKGFMAMARHVRESATDYKPDQKIPWTPFKLQIAAPSSPTRFDCDVIVENIRYHYGFRFTAAAFVEEWLYVWPEGARQLWFHREGPDKEKWYFGPAFRGRKEELRRATRPNSLLLSEAAQAYHPQLMGLWGCFSQVVRRGSADLHHRSWFSGSPLFEPERRNQVVALLRAADLGVMDIHILNRRTRVVEQLPIFGAPGMAADVQSQMSDGFGDPRALCLGHRGEGGNVLWLDEDEESDGTHVLISHVHSVLSTLEEGGILLLDEMDRSLHPQLCLRILELFGDPAANPRNAQILFATFADRLMGHLRRDEIVLVDKDLEGKSSVVAMSSYKPLKREDLREAYAEGRFGAIPRTMDFRRALRVPCHPSISGSSWTLEAE